MSTRGAVAWREGKNVKAVYNNSSSYPTGLGAAVFKQARQMGLGNLRDLLKRLTDWREIETDGVCRYCGKLAGQPHDMSAILMGYTGWSRAEFVKMRQRQSERRPDLQETYQREIALLDEVEANKQKTGYPDPDAKWHKHNGTPAEEQFDPFKDPLYMEWVYVLCAETNTIEIWVGCVQYSEALPGKYPRWSGVEHKCRSGEERWTHVHVADVGLGKEPDWQAIEDAGRAIRTEAERLAQVHTVGR